MTKICQVENCPCCFHRVVDPSVPKKIGRPPAQLIDENHKKCRLCNEIKELAEMRPKRNECIICYNKFQREYYKTNDKYNKYKKSKVNEYKKKLNPPSTPPQQQVDSA